MRKLAVSTAVGVAVAFALGTFAESRPALADFVGLYNFNKVFLDDKEPGTIGDAGGLRPYTSPDESGNKNHLSLLGGAALGPGLFEGSGRRALDTDGEDDRAEAANEADFDFTSVPSAFTLQGWFNIQAPGGDLAPRVVSKGNSAGDTNGAYSIFVFDDGRDDIGFFVIDVDGDLNSTRNTNIDGSTLASDNSVYAAGEWHHVAATYVTPAPAVAPSLATDCIGKLYLDGGLIATGIFPQTIAAPCAPRDVDTAFTIGGVSGIGNEGDERDFNGLIELVMVHHRALSADEIAASADMGFNDGSSALGYLPEEIETVKSSPASFVYTAEWDIEDVGMTDPIIVNVDIVTADPLVEIDAGSVVIDPEESENIASTMFTSIFSGKGLQVEISRSDLDEDAELVFDVVVTDSALFSRTISVEIEIDD